jgi:hypothetical protein
MSNMNTHRIVEEAKRLGYIVEPAKGNDGEAMEGVTAFRQPGHKYETFRFMLTGTVWHLFDVHMSRYNGTSRSGKSETDWKIGSALNDLREMRRPELDSAEYQGERG